MRGEFVWRLLIVMLLVGLGSAGEGAVAAAEVSDVHIIKQVADRSEFIAVQGGVLARANPDGTRVIVACTEADQGTTFINEEKGVFWQGPLEQFYDDLHLFVIVHLLSDEPGLLYTVQVLVEEVGEDVVADRVSRHFLVQWRPSAEEGGDGMA